MPEKSESDPPKSVEREDLEDASRTALLQGRMILPGIQTLFGFQLAVVFTDRFGGLPLRHKMLHMSALLCIAVAIGLVVFPAAYHRQVEPGYVSQRLLRIINRVLTASLVPLMLALSAEVYLLVSFVFGSRALAIAIAAPLFLFFAALWFVYPRIMRARDPLPRTSGAHRDSGDAGRALRPSG